jgi:hypothetical protein
MSTMLKKGDKVKHEHWEYIVSDILDDPDRPDDPLIQLEPIQPSKIYRSASDLVLIQN